jgi:hypothetical protein
MINVFTKSGYVTKTKVKNDRSGHEERSCDQSEGFSPLFAMEILFLQKVGVYFLIIF